MDATWIISTCVLSDIAMMNLDHHTGGRAGVPDSAVVTVALVAAKYFANNQRIALLTSNQGMLSNAGTPKQTERRTRRSYKTQQHRAIRSSHAMRQLHSCTFVDKDSFLRNIVLKSQIGWFDYYKKEKTNATQFRCIHCPCT
jgi:hypothetical protein